MLVGGIVLVALIVVNLLIARYMHKDALKRGVKNNEFWLLIGFIREAKTQKQNNIFLFLFHFFI